MRGFDLWGGERMMAEDLGVMKVLREQGADGTPYVKLWYPKAIKPFANYRFSSLERREAYIQEQLGNLKRHKEIVAQRKLARIGTKEQLDAVKVGDIFHFSWGYDQTNCDFFQVVAKRGRFVDIREIGAKRTGQESGPMSCYLTANKGQFLADKPTLTKKVQFSQGTPYLTMASYGWCSLWDGKPEYCSWYA